MAKRMIATGRTFMGSLKDIVVIESKNLKNVKILHILKSGAVIDSVGPCDGRFQEIVYEGVIGYVDSHDVRFEDV